MLEGAELYGNAGSAAAGRWSTRPPGRTRASGWSARRCDASLQLSEPPSHNTHKTPKPIKPTKSTKPIKPTKDCRFPSKLPKRGSVLSKRTLGSGRTAAKRRLDLSVRRAPRGALTHRPNRGRRSRRNYSRRVTRGRTSARRRSSACSTTERTTTRRTARFAVSGISRDVGTRHH